MFRYLGPGLDFLFALLLGRLTNRLPERWRYGFRRFEQKRFHRVATQGPGGFDDAVQMHSIRNAERYSDSLIRMLKTSKAGTATQEAALEFIELVRGPADVDVLLRDYAEHHPDPQVSEFILDVIASPTSQEILARGRRTAETTTRR